MPTFAFYIDAVNNQLYHGSHLVSDNDTIVGTSSSPSITDFIVNKPVKEGNIYGLTYIDAGPGPPATVARTVSHTERGVCHRDLETTSSLLQSFSRVRELACVPTYDVIGHPHPVHNVHRLQSVMSSIR